LKDYRLIPLIFPRLAISQYLYTKTLVLVKQSQKKKASIVRENTVDAFSSLVTTMLPLRIILTDLILCFFAMRNAFLIGFVIFYSYFMENMLVV
jgi:hypothetical protein